MRQGGITCMVYGHHTPPREAQATFADLDYSNKRFIAQQCHSEFIDTTCFWTTDVYPGIIHTKRTVDKYLFETEKYALAFHLLR